MQKIGFIGLILVLCVCGCKDNTLPPEQLTNIPVIRNAEEAGNSVKKSGNNTPATSQTVPGEPATTVSTQPERMQWYIIVASYSSSERQRAEKLVKGLKREGYPAQILHLKGRLRVSIEDYPSEEKAYERRAEFLKIPGFEGTWIVKLPVKTE